VIDADETCSKYPKRSSPAVCGRERDGTAGVGALLEMATGRNPSDSAVPYLSYGPPWAHYLGGYQDRLLGGPLRLPDLRCTVPDGVKHKDYRGEVLG
jgi:hypothetical protein